MNKLLTGVLLILVLSIPTSCLKDEKSLKIMTKREFIHRKYLKDMVKYMNSVVMLYPKCEIREPHMPKITIVRTNKIHKHCGRTARACYYPGTAHIFYEKGDYEALKHEFGHHILHYNPDLRMSCWHELILQQADTIRKDEFDGKRGRWKKGVPQTD